MTWRQGQPYLVVSQFCSWATHSISFSVFPICWKWAVSVEMDTECWPVGNSRSPRFHFISQLIAMRSLVYTYLKVHIVSALSWRELLSSELARSISSNLSGSELLAVHIINPFERSVIIDKKRPRWTAAKSTKLSRVCPQQCGSNNEGPINVLIGVCEPKSLEMFRTSVHIFQCLHDLHIVHMLFRQNFATCAGICFYAWPS